MGGRVIPGSEPVVVKIYTDEGIVGIAEAGHASLGYIGEADIFVLVFFGPVALAGTYYVQTLSLNLPVLVALAPVNAPFS